MIRVDYHVVVLYEPNGDAVAFVKGDGPDIEQPLRGEGRTPIEALAALAERLRQWGHGGADRWLSTPHGRAFIEEIKLRIGDADEQTSTSTRKPS